MEVMRNVGPTDLHMAAPADEVAIHTGVDFELGTGEFARRQDVVVDSLRNAHVAVSRWRVVVGETFEDSEWAQLARET
jgi:hypothetical protein